MRLGCIVESGVAAAVATVAHSAVGCSSGAADTAAALGMRRQRSYSAVIHSPPHNHLVAAVQDHLPHIGRMLAAVAQGMPAAVRTDILHFGPAGADSGCTGRTGRTGPAGAADSRTCRWWKGDPVM